MWDAIFQFLFKYPSIAFSRGRLTLASGWPVWLLLLISVIVIAAVGHHLWRRRPALPIRTRLVVWGLQSGIFVILLLLLWRPSLVVSMQSPQQNVVAVLIDDSSSMNLAEDGTRRIDQVEKTFSDSGPLMNQLRQKFQLRLYRFSKDTGRITSAAGLAAKGASSHLQESLAQAYGELRHLPLAGMVVVSDGAENGALISNPLLEDLKARKVPVYALGVGEPEFDRDVQIDDLAMPRAALPGSVISATATVRQRGYLGERVRLEVRDGSDILKTREIRFGPSPLETVPLNFVPKSKGLREYTVSVTPLSGEQLTQNNHIRHGRYSSPVIAG